MLAQRLPTILPPLTPPRAWRRRASTAPWAGCQPDEPLLATRPFRSPHHTSATPAWSAAAARRRRARSRWPTTASCSSTSCPSSIAAAWRCCASRWRRAASPSRGRCNSTTFPASFILVAAMNPCPCGYLGDAEARLQVHADADRDATWAGSAGRCWTASTCTSRCRRCRSRNCRPRPTAPAAPRMREQVHQARAVQAERFGADSSGAQQPDEHAGSCGKYCVLDAEGQGAAARRRWTTWACRPGPTTASCAWRGPSPTWTAATRSRPAHVVEAIGYRSLDRKLWAR